ncbi:MAG: hypothetical protein V1908_04180 [Candidatus Peregrinibacteria bacterium]
MKLGRFFLGILGGLTFGMLFAPKKGKDLRKEIIKKSGESPSEGLKALGSALAEAGTEAYNEACKLSQDEQVKEKMGEFMETAKDKGYEIAATVQDKLEQAGDFLKEEAYKSVRRKKGNK